VEIQVIIMLLVVAIISYTVIMMVQYQETIEKTVPKKRCEYCANYIRYDIFKQKCSWFRRDGECAKYCNFYVELPKCPKCNKPVIVRNWSSRFIGHGYFAECPSCDYHTEVIWTKEDGKEIIKEVNNA
jgi:predicted RNA-binding Zn-ribbon protein involved in translation (DUF1610 family)